MSIVDRGIIVTVGVILVAVVRYLYKAKKRGETCIGCPYAKQCGGNCHTSAENERKR